MKLFVKIIKKIIISCLILYIFDFFSIKYNFIIPINFFSTVIVSLFGTFGLIGLFLFKILIL